MEELRNSFNPKAVISGSIGPRFDGYKIDHKMTEDEAEIYHS